VQELHQENLELKKELKIQLLSYENLEKRLEKLENK